MLTSLPPSPMQHTRFFRMRADQAGNVCFLGRGTATRHDSGELRRDLDELALE